MVKINESEKPDIKPGSIILTPEPMLERKSHPLFLPPGSIRAILTLIILGATVYVEVRGKIPSEMLKGLCYLSLGFYFAKGVKTISDSKFK